MNSLYQWMLAMVICVLADISLGRTGSTMMHDMVWVTAAYVIAELLWLLWSCLVRSSLARTISTAVGRYPPPAPPHSRPRGTVSSHTVPPDEFDHAHVAPWRLLESHPLGKLARLFLSTKERRYTLGEIAIFLGIYLWLALFFVVILYFLFESLWPQPTEALGWACFWIWLGLVIGMWTLIVVQGRAEPKPTIADRDLTILQVFFMLFAFHTAATLPDKGGGEGELLVGFMKLFFLLFHLLYFSLAWGMRVRVPPKIYLLFGAIVAASILREL